MKREEWIKGQEEVYASRGFGETERSFKVNEYRYHVALGFIGAPPKNVLDVGCNDGFFTEYLRLRGFKTVGVDLAEVIAQAEKLHPLCKFQTVNMDTESDPLPGYHGYFDFVSALEIIEHLYYDTHFLQLMACYLKKGGQIVLTTPATGEVSFSHIRFYPLESLRKLTEYSGFEIVQLHTANGYNVVVARKE
jgi:2-polyprenyl-3-methyl-5-hydroxy-6-metoxy-1,4-benzoquinol methylase